LQKEAFFEYLASCIVYYGVEDPEVISQLFQRYIYPWGYEYRRADSDYMIAKLWYSLKMSLINLGVHPDRPVIRGITDRIGALGMTYVVAEEYLLDRSRRLFLVGQSAQVQQGQEESGLPVRFYIEE